VIALTEQESRWVAGVANRLRLVHADTTSATPAQRREYLNEEITRHLKEVAPGNRRRYVEALLARFPVAGQTLRAAALPAPPPPPPPQETLEQLLERFLKAAHDLPEPKRSEVANRLAAEGLAKVDPEAVVQEVMDELRQGLGLPADHQPRLQRLVQLALLLVKGLQGLDQMALATLRGIDPKSSLLKRPPFSAGAAAKFLTQEESSLEPEARMVVDLLAALLKAFADGGRDFGAQYVQRMSPAAIRDVVLAEGKRSVIPGFGKNTEELCWDKYLQLAKDYETADKVNQRIRECLVTFIEQKVLRSR
jgi:hypothetical protein